MYTYFPASQPGWGWTGLDWTVSMVCMYGHGFTFIIMCVLYAGTDG